MTDTADLSLYTLEGHDRDGAAAMLSQARLKTNPIDDIQVQHLLHIGYRAGRAVTEADAVFDRTDARLGRWALLAYGAAAGAVLTGVMMWLIG